MSLSGCLPNLVMLMPEDPDVVAAVHRLPSSRSVRSRSRWPRCRRRRRRRSRSPAAPSCRACTCSGSGSTLMTLARTLVPSQSTTPATNGTGMPGAANATIVNACSSPSVATSTFRKSVAEARRARVAPVEEPGAARSALVGDQVGIGIERPGSRRSGLVRSRHLQRRALPEPYRCGRRETETSGVGRGS